MRMRASTSPLGRENTSGAMVSTPWSSFRSSEALVSGRPAGRLHRVGAEAQHRVGGAHAGEVERRVRQEPPFSLALGGLRLFQRGRHARLGRADDGAEVADIDAMGMQIGLQLGPVVDPFDLKVPGQIAGADRPVNLGKGVAMALAVQIARQLERRGVGQGQAGQFVEVGEIAAGDAERGLNLAQVERPGQHPVGDHARVGRAHVRVEVVGLVGVDVQQWRAGDRNLERAAVQRAAPDQLERAAAGRAGDLMGFDHPADAELAREVGEPQPAAVDQEAFDQRQFGRLVAAEISAPVGAARRVDEQPDFRPFQLQQLQVPVAGEQRPQTHRRWWRWECRPSARRPPISDCRWSGRPRQRAGSRRRDRPSGRH